MADFTEIYKQSASLCRFSPDGQYLATAVQQRLVVRQADSLQIVQLYSCLENIQEIEWAPDSKLILCCSFKLKTWNVFNLSDEAWSCQVDEGLAGVCRVRFCPDSRSIMSFSDYNLRITIWSLCTKDATYIQFPKYSDRGYQFRSDGKYFALCEREDSKDYIGIYDCSDWTMIKRWPVDTNNLQDLSWSPDGRFIAVWEPLTEYRILVYFPDGRLLADYSPYEFGLGIKTVTWAPSGQFLTIGSYDQKCRLLNYYTWKPLAELSHPKQILPADITVYNECDMTDLKQNKLAWSQAVGPKVKYEVSTGPVTVFQTKSDPDRPNPKMGVGLVEYSCTGHLLVTINDNQPCSLWIWDIMELRQVCLIQQTMPIKMLHWNPVQADRLAFCSGNGTLYLYDRHYGCDAIQVPAVNFQVMSFSWNPDGKSLLLMDKDKFCVSFLIDE